LREGCFGNQEIFFAVTVVAAVGAGQVAVDFGARRDRGETS